MEPVVSFHGRQQAVGHSVRENELDVLGTEILEIVVVSVHRLEAVGSIWSDVHEEGQVQKMVVDLGVSCQSPVQVEVSRLV